MKAQHHLSVFMVGSDQQQIERFSFALQSWKLRDIQALQSGEACMEHIYQRPEVVFLSSHIQGSMDVNTVINCILENSATTHIIYLRDGAEQLPTALEHERCFHAAADGSNMKRIALFLRQINKLKYQRMIDRYTWGMVASVVACSTAMLSAHLFASGAL